MKKVAISQSNYIPWKGYFDIIASVDEFIVYDDMQFTRRDWRNRNLIKTPNGLLWLTVPVKVKGKYHQTIRETELQGGDWAVTHWKSLEVNYRRAPHFDEIATLIKPLYETEYGTISELNRSFLKVICTYLGITTKISNCWDYELVDGQTEKLVSLCEQVNADVYVSGPAAKDYMVETLFSDRGIGVEWFDYGGYTEYPQLWGEFAHGVSILDLMFNCGTEAPHWMKYAK